MYKRIITFLIIFIIYSQMNAQIFISSDPFYILEQEKIHNDQFREWLDKAFQERISNVFWFGVERNFNKNEIVKLFNQYINKK